MQVKSSKLLLKFTQFKQRTIILCHKIKHSQYITSVMWCISESEQEKWGLDHEKWALQTKMEWDFADFQAIFEASICWKPSNWLGYGRWKSLYRWSNLFLFDTVAVSFIM